MQGYNPDMIQGLAGTALIVAAGWLLAAFGWVGSESRQPLMRLVIWLFFPALIYDRVHNNPLIATGSAAALYVGTGFAMVVSGIVIGVIVGKLLRVGQGVSERTFAYASGINNFGYIGIPITAALFDNDVVGVLLVHNVGVEAAVWTIGIAHLSAHSGVRVLRNLIHPMTMILALALAVNLFGFGNSTVPAFFGKVCHDVGSCAVPVGLILTGIYMHETLRGFRFWSDPRATLGFVLVRLLFAPLVVLLAASFITDDNLRRVMLVQAAMPAGIFTFLIVGHCKGDVPLALRGTIVTSILCPLTIPIWIEIGRRWLGIHSL